MPGKVRAYLHRRWQEQGGHRRDSEAEAALACLPEGTCVVQYESIPQMETVTRGAGVVERGYIVFLNVPKYVVVGPDRETASIGRLTYFPESKILISKMLGHPHEVAARWLTPALAMSVTRMGMDWDDELTDCGSAFAEQIHKEPDMSIQPVILPAGRSTEWPTLVLEVGPSES